MNGAPGSSDWVMGLIVGALAMVVVRGWWDAVTSFRRAPRRGADLGLSCDRVHKVRADCGCRLKADTVGADFKFCDYHYLHQPPRR